MQKRKAPHPTVERLLDTAEAIVAEDGLAGLTYDRLSRRAGVAKGTVLYHFASKEDLITAMIERLVLRFDAAFADAMEADGVERGRAVRAYIEATHHGDPFTGESFDRVNGAITAALANTPDRVIAVKEQGRRHQDAIVKDAADPVLATIIRMAIDGLWFAESLGLMTYDPAVKAEVLARLRAWSYGRELPPDGSGATSKHEGKET